MDVRVTGRLVMITCVYTCPEARRQTWEGSFTLHSSIYVSLEGTEYLLYYVVHDCVIVGNADTLANERTRKERE